MKRIILLVCSAVFAFSFISCSKTDSVKNEKVALLLPSGSLTSRWHIDASYLTQSLKSYGYEVELYTVDENQAGAAQQVQQLEKVLGEGCRNIVITAEDYSLINKSGLLEAKPECNIFCYDRMINDNPAVDFYLTCDPVRIGEAQAQFLLGQVGNDSKTIELFAGPYSDLNSVYYFDSAVKLLNKSPLLSVPSGKKTYAETALPDWSEESAKAEMLARLAETHTVPDMILAPNDNVANGIIKAVEEYAPGVYPIITGLDMTDGAIANIKAGKQSMTISINYDDMAETTAMVVNCFISGKPVITSQYFDNGKIKVPTKYTNFSLVTIHNIEN